MTFEGPTSESPTHVLLTGAAGFVGSHMLKRLLLTTDWVIHCPVSFRHHGNPERITEVIADVELVDSTVGKTAWERVRIEPCDLALPVGHTLLAAWSQCSYVFNVASSSHVDRSITDPGEFICNNVALQTTVLDAARQMPNIEVFLQMSTDEVYGPAHGEYRHAEWDAILPSNPYSASKAAQEAIAYSYWRTYDLPIVITNCYDMQTRVMTEHGFKGHADVKVGDRVWTLDANENLVLETVQRTVRMPGDGHMVRFKGNGVDQLVTRNHRMMVRRPLKGGSRQYGVIEEAHAETFLGMKDRVRIPRTGAWTGLDPGVIFRPYDYIDDTPHVSGKRLPIEMSTEHVARLFGWFISEGCVSGTTVAMGAGSEAQQCIMFDLFKEIDGNAYLNGRSVRIANKHLADLMSLCGRGSKNIEVPEFIRAWDTKYLRIFYDAMIAGDGSRSKTGLSDVYYTSSWKLVEHMSEIGMKLGYSVRITERQTEHPQPHNDALSTSWIVRLSTCKGDIESRNVTDEDYDGDVWCLSVPSGRVFVERNGVVSLSGQTMNIIGERQDPEKFLPLIISRLLRGEEIIVHSNAAGESGSRFYLHAGNLADAWLHLTSHYRARPLPFINEVPRHSAGADRPARFNIVGEREIRNDGLVRLVANILHDLGALPAGESGDAVATRLMRHVDFHSSRPGHDLRYALDDAKLSAAGWVPPMPLTPSITQTVAWYLANPRWLNV